jgi:nitroimidazol reductase NimA-like FMN-containing flavoprotein (pyridoxamine 5'-phosphate oxidase superfamily)
MQVATLTREHHVTKRVKKVKTKSKGLPICIMSQEHSTLVDLIVTESGATTTGWMDAEFRARHTEIDEDFL